MDAGALIDAAAPERVVVLGSPPPEGRDWDVLVRPVSGTTLASVLAENDFHSQGRTWARFAGGRTEVVELIPAAELGLAGDQLDRLFREARPLGEWRSLYCPAPHHRLLLTARRVVAESRLDEKRRAIAGDANEEAWRQAREASPAWRADTALAQLEQAMRRTPPRSWCLRSPLARLARYRPGALIALSGLDGSGKSTQAEGVAQALTALGYPTVRIWTSLSAHPSLNRVAAPMRALLEGPRRADGEQRERPPAGEDDHRLAQLRESRPWLQCLWVTFVTGMNAWSQARAVSPHLLRGRIVICDRYTLDSLVQLRYRYGATRRFRPQLALIRSVSPSPLRAFLLDVAPAEAYSRNREYTLEQIELRAALYREEYEALGVTRLDGGRSRETLQTQIVLDVWSSLRAKDAGRRRSIPEALLRALRGLQRS